MASSASEKRILIGCLSTYDASASITPAGGSSSQDWKCMIRPTSLSQSRLKPANKKKKEELIYMLAYHQLKLVADTGRLKPTVRHARDTDQRPEPTAKETLAGIQAWLAFRRPGL